MPPLESELKRTIRTVPGYKGVVFRDLTTIWKDPALSKKVTAALAKIGREKRVDKVVGIEARGFIVGAPLAERLKVGFVPARKIGKLPADKVEEEYDLEYGKAGLEIHSDAIGRGERILIVDDLLATGGTSRAAKNLVERLGGKVVGFAFITELQALGGRKRLAGYEVHSLSKYAQGE